MNRKLAFLTISISAMCLSSPVLPQQTGASAAPQTGIIAPPPAGKAQVVFYRPRELYAMTRPCLVYESGTIAARVGNGKYTVRTYEPGTYPFNATAETYGTDEVGRVLYNIELLAGGTVYLKCYMKMGNNSAYSAFVPAYQVSFDEIARRLSRAK